MSGNTIEIFSDIGLTDDEINQKYPKNQYEHQDITHRVSNWIEQHPIIFSVTIIIILIILVDLNLTKKSIKIIQSGGNPMENTRNDMMNSDGTGKETMRKIKSPVSSTFGMVTGALGKFLKLLLLLVMIVLVPTIPILLYCLVAYYIIKKFLLMFTKIK